MATLKSTYIHKVSILNPVKHQGDLPKLETCEILDIRFESSVYFTSIGIREWFNWIKPAAQDVTVRIRLSEVPSTVMQTVNIVTGFLPKNAEILSFYAPFYSEELDETKMILLEQGVHYSSQFIQIPVVKDAKGNSMELDVDQKIIFRFLRQDP